MHKRPSLNPIYLAGSMNLSNVEVFNVDKALLLRGRYGKQIAAGNGNVTIDEFQQALEAVL